MVHASSVAFDEMRGKLLPLDEVRKRLEATEPLRETKFEVGKGVRFRFSDGWQKKTDNQVTDVVMTTGDLLQGGRELRLTKKAILEAGAAAGVPRKLQEGFPNHINEQICNWWFQNGAGDRSFKAMTLEREDQDDVVLALTRGTVSPFSNLRLVDAAVEGIEAKYGKGTEILGDYKFHHDIEHTDIKLIVPGASRVINGTRVADDTWSTGLRVANSLTWLDQAQLDGYLFRWWCTNGCFDTMSSSGGFSRRNAHTEDEVMEWARKSVDDVLGGLEGAFDDVQQLTQINVEGDIRVILRDLFEQYHIPQREGRRVIESLVDVGGELTMYDVQNAITEAANMEMLDRRAVNQLLTMGGHTMHAASGRCNECRRLLPAGYVVPEHHSPAEVAGLN